MVAPMSLVLRLNIIIDFTLDQEECHICGAGKSGRNGRVMRTLTPVEGHRCTIPGESVSSHLLVSPCLGRADE